MTPIFDPESSNFKKWLDSWEDVPSYNWSQRFEGHRGERSNLFLLNISYILYPRHYI